MKERVLKRGRWTRLLGAAVLALLLTGCLRTHYDLTLTNGDIIRAKNKPKLNGQGFYIFKDVSGRETAINKMRVRQIEPVRPGSRSESPFLPQ